ncbi:SIR2 family NAD-dependent protein deacylase [Thermorudis peleae]|uniref:SIR2 family NAD-dependent protein deacylase n=1 Tax=Thermorudis peleae TaxID=1382356 RepID=UPI00056E1755|nr:Sir2 family NAD-dependent protein deacetylase [Thermorudis peleae]MBX6752826.1 Sir2 family NAD-dependent protein deacetylase [Thermorudis peleae]
MDIALTDEQRRALEQLADKLYQTQPAIAFTGAGISTESGIPDYRGPNGLWSKHNPTKFRDFLRDPEIRRVYWNRRRARYPVLCQARPNVGHLVLARLQQAGLLQEIITQNIDGLHQAAGSPPDSVIELHGTAHEIRCLDCGARWPAADFDPGPPDTIPVCPHCGGIVKEATVSFGEPLDKAELNRALRLAQSSALMLVIGTSLSVYPAAYVPRRALQHGALVAVINNEPTPLDAQATIVVHSSAGAALEYLASLLLAPQSTAFA